jgi:predicted dehydrogenase
MTSIGIGLVGLDHWYSAIPLAEGVVRNPATRLVAIADNDLDRAQEVAARCGVDRVENDWRVVVGDPEVAVVLCFASLDQNPIICKASAEAGKHIISNKPVGRSIEDATSVRSAVRAAGVHLFPGESRQRLGPRNVALREWSRAGNPGRLCSATMSIWAGLPRRWPDDERPGWFVDPDRTLGGAWADHAIYEIDILRWVLGEEVTSVSGVTAKLVHEQLAAEDYGVAIVTFSGGLVATLENTWTAPTGGFQSSSRLVGSKGAFDLNGITDRQLMIGRDFFSSGWAETKQPAVHDQGADIDHFVAVIREEVEPVATVDDAWYNLAACLAFYDSARTGQRVSPLSMPQLQPVTR